MITSPQPIVRQRSSGEDMDGGAYVGSFSAPVRLRGSMGVVASGRVKKFAKRTSPNHKP